MKGYFGNIECWVSAGFILSRGRGDPLRLEVGQVP